MTDLVNLYNETFVSIQTSQPSPNASPTLSEESVQDKRAHSPHTSFPTTNQRMEIDEENPQPESLNKTKENDFRKPERETKAVKNIYVASHEMLSDISNTEETDDDSDAIDPELQDILKSKPAEISHKLKNKLKELENVTLNIAVTGMTGAGKSTFVNALRGLHNDDLKAAPTGTTKATMKPEMYPHPSMPNVNIWDLPGIGSPKFKAKTYLKDVTFKTYDFFLIVTSERFRKNDIDLAKAIQKRKKRFYFIRNKIDNDIRAEKQKRDFDEQKLLNIIREDCENNLQKVKNGKIFLISSFELKKYDFQKLVNTLEEELPENKRFALIQSLPVYSNESLRKKKAYFKKMIWLNAFAAGLGAVVPIPGVSLACKYGILKNFFQQVIKGFGLSDDAMETLSKRVNKPVDLLKAAKTSRFKYGVRKAVVIDMLSERVVFIANILRRIISILPGGALPAKVTDVASVYYLLNKGLNEMAEDIKNVLIVSELVVSD